MSDGMKKDELIDVHTVVRLASRRITERDTLSEDDLSEYHTKGVYPVHVHRDKTPHKEALFTLCEELGDWIETEQNEDCEDPQRTEVEA